MSAPVLVEDLDRKTYIGGSDIAAILGLDAYGKTPLTCYLQKVGELKGEMDPGKKLWLERRKRWEPVVVQMLREEFDGEIVAVNRRYVDGDYPFLGAEIDFEWRDADGSIQNGEIKTVHPFAFGESHGWGEEGTDEIPVQYHAQVMHGLGITLRRTTIVCPLIGVDNLLFYRVDRDDETIIGMRLAAIKFWQENVLKLIPPDVSSLEDITMMFARKRGRPVDLDDETAKALTDLQSVMARMNALEKNRDELKLKVGKYVCQKWGMNMTDAEIDNALLLYNGVELGRWAAGRGAHLDQKSFGHDHPGLKTQYTVPHYFRRFWFTKP